MALEGSLKSIIPRAGMSFSPINPKGRDVILTLSPQDPIFLSFIAVTAFEQNGLFQAINHIIWVLEFFNIILRWPRKAILRQYRNS